jgi:hypothetical protein
MQSILSKASHVEWMQSQCFLRHVTKEFDDKSYNFLVVAISRTPLLFTLIGIHTQPNENAVEHWRERGKHH